MESLRKISKVLKIFSLTGMYLHLANKSNADLISLKKRWAVDILSQLKIDIEIKGTLSQPNKSTIFIGNHISYLDIPVLISAAPEVSFVSKKELQTWPIFGNAATKAQTIFVDRGSITSRQIVKEKIAEVANSGLKSIAIFPSGTTSIAPTDRWKKGAFEIASENKLLIQPFRFIYQPLRKAAYIDKDNFLSHLYDICGLPSIKVQLEFESPTQVVDPLADCNRWKSWCEARFDFKP